MDMTLYGAPARLRACRVVDPLAVEWGFSGCDMQVCYYVRRGFTIRICACMQVYNKACCTLLPRDLVIKLNAIHVVNISTDPDAAHSHSGPFAIRTLRTKPGCYRMNINCTCMCELLFHAMRATQLTQVQFDYVD